jgi:hypothetical protein
MEDFYRMVWEKLPWYLKLTAWYNKYIPPFRWIVQKVTYKQLKRLASGTDGTLGWDRNGDTGKTNAFFGSMEQYRKIPGWDKPLPSLDHHQEYVKLDHGYDESKERLITRDLQEAARFRGGDLVSPEWTGDLHARLTWRCCQGHEFQMTPHAVLKGGHWCLGCISPPWDYQLIAGKNRFAAQVLSQSPS